MKATREAKSIGLDRLRGRGLRLGQARGQSAGTRTG